MLAGHKLESPEKGISVEELARTGWPVSNFWGGGVILNVDRGGKTHPDCGRRPFAG